MTVRKPRYPMDEFVRRGQEIYDRVVRPALRPEDEECFVAIDIETDCYEVDRNDYAASERLLKRQPDAQIWIERIGHRAAYRMGGRTLGGDQK